ncbi:ATP-binding protein [Streptomyces actuosus]|uniref:ATP-binding protein n=1 Tax=Streptomyces actuosus TaxID=1885 RepID=A0ABS2VLL8_STRAS|nr:ATP-binding protein [Streptomyces actuosus]MBN0043994.1 ATP-binding protein [Streptomyces actuosus]
MASVIPSAPLGTDAADHFGLPADGSPLAGRRFRFELAAHPSSPARARRLTRARLNGWEVCEDTCDTAALVVSELVTNAVVHTASRVVVCELRDGGDRVRIAVLDEGCAPGGPSAAQGRPEEEHGRGLLLVDTLCHAWGAHEHGPGLLVWAELPRQADPPGTPAGPRDDLGWGARPKPGPADGDPGDGDEAQRTEAPPQQTATARRAGRRPSGDGTEHHVAGGEWA